MPSNSVQNLLFGIIARQMDFVRREQLVAATSTWLTDTSRQIDEILVEHGALSESDRHLLVPLVARHIENHDGDPQQSLAALSSIGSVADELRSLGDKSVEATLSMVTSNRASDFHKETAVYESKAPTARDATRDTTDARFRILRSHAKGGLGEVYVAKDTELNREVALKEIQTKYADDQASRMRFLLEAEVTGGLEHPGIVPVYGLGRYDNGRPFYAMRFIKGDSLQEAADRFHGSAASDSDLEFNGVEFRKLLGRFVDVCQAIEYAHSRGVLHRDLKPGNIMLGKYGETLVVDWGLAKAQGQVDDNRVEGETTFRPASASGSAPTAMGSAIGTPAFMPPEQAAGDLEKLGPQSDVYSLGATLYYLLTGQSPFSSKEIQRLLQQVQNGDFAEPRQVKLAIPKSLEAICLRAMSNRPESRYASAQELAEDVERFLADEPVSAFAEPVAARVRRWVRKHQTLTSATAAVVLVSVVGLIVFSSVVSGKNAELKNLNVSLDQKNVELEEKNTALIEANGRETKARELAQANEQAAREQSQLALATLTSVIVDIERGLRHVPGGGEVRRSLLATSLERLDRLATKYLAKATVDARTMEALLSMGDVIWQFGPGNTERDSAVLPSLTKEKESTVQLAATFYTRAHDIATKLSSVDPNNSELRADLAISFDRMGKVSLHLGRLQEASAYYQQSHTINAELAAENPIDRQSLYNLSLSYLHLGDVSRQGGELSGSLTCYRQMKDVLDQMLEGNPADVRARRHLATALSRLGNVSAQTGDLPRATRFLQQALQVLKDLTVAHPTNTEDQLNFVLAHKGLGDVNRAMGNPQKALAYFEQMNKRAAEILIADPSLTQAKWALAISHHRLGLTHQQSGRMEEAFQALSKFNKSYEELAAADPANVDLQRGLSISYQDLGDIILASGRADEALDFYRKRHEISVMLAGVDRQDARAQRDLSISYERLGNATLRAGRADEALEYFRQRHEIAESLAAADSINAQTQQDLSISFERLGAACLEAGRFNEALGFIENSLERAEKNAADDPKNAAAHRNVVICRLRLGSIREELEDYQAALADYNAGAKVLKRMIVQRMNVETSKRELVILEEAAIRVELKPTALGDWNALLKQNAQALPMLLDLRGVEFVTRSRFDEAAQAAAKLRELDNAGYGRLYNAACVFGRCAASIKSAEGEELTAERSMQRQTWINDAIATLKQAIAAGWDDFDHMQKDEDLATIRDRPEFKALIP